MVSTIRYSANASSDHHPNQVPGILIIMNPKQPNLPTCSVTSTYLLFHLLSNPSLHLIANTTLGIIMTAIKISPKTLNHSILSTITNFDFLNSPNWKFFSATHQSILTVSAEQFPAYLLVLQFSIYITVFKGIVSAYRFSSYVNILNITNLYLLKCILNNRHI